ncbi:MAG: hypothetical protein ACREBP_00595, partial [Sphingomicrobium sp.]
IECDGSVSSSDDCADGETMSKWISVEVTDQYKPLFPVHLAGIDADGTYHIKSTAGMRIQ